MQASFETAKLSRAMALHCDPLEGWENLGEFADVGACDAGLRLSWRCTSSFEPQGRD